MDGFSTGMALTRQWLLCLYWVANPW